MGLCETRITDAYKIKEIFISIWKFVRPLEDASLIKHQSIGAHGIKILSLLYLYTFLPLAVLARAFSRVNSDTLATTRRSPLARIARLPVAVALSPFSPLSPAPSRRLSSSRRPAGR